MSACRITATEQAIIKAAYKMDQHRRDNHWPLTDYVKGHPLRELYRAVLADRKAKRGRVERP